jgi:hypothetical protein
VDGAASGGRRDGDGGWAVGGSGAVAPIVVVVGRSGEILGIANLDAARGIDGARQGQVSVEAVVGRQPDGWVVIVDSREGDVSGLVSAVAASGAAAPLTLLAVTPAGEVLGTVTLADLSAAFTR